jgi:hypothetical protein
VSSCILRDDDDNDDDDDDDDVSGEECWNMCVTYTCLLSYQTLLTLYVSLQYVSLQGVSPFYRRAECGSASSVIKILYVAW